MPKENQPDPRKNFTLRYLPWLLGATMLIVYLITLNPWVTLINIGQVATVSGWIWQPQLSNPLQFLVLLPFHLLPDGKIPLALNLFSAVCAALALTMLARSVAILPHDRTHTERQRERSDYSFLTGWMAFFPPILAVVLIGLQLTFWEHATSFTGESFELLLFAGIIWQFLEYRLDEKESRLYWTALIYGLGIAENWAFVAYFPVFITALIWLRKWEFFNILFLGRMLMRGFAGTLLILLLPLIARISGKFGLTLWQALHPALSLDGSVLHGLADSIVWHNLALISLATLVPVLAISIRWSTTFGDSSRTGTVLVNYLIYFVHAIFFTVCVWVMFDPAFGARRADYNFPYPFLGAPALTLYYLSALSVGYFCGFFLLVFGKMPKRSRRNFRPDQVLPEFLMWLCPVIVVGTFTAATLAIGLLIYKNAPIVHAVNDNTLLKYAQYTTQNLPPGGAILLSDVDAINNQPIHTLLIQAELARQGRTKDYPVVNTDALKWAPYHRFLHEHFPKQWPQIFKDDDLGAANPLQLLGLLNQLAKSNTICYLNPSFGYYFESFYQEPHGLNYTMKLLPEDTLLPPPLDKNVIAENQQFWSEVTGSVSPKIEKALATPDQNQSLNFANWLLAQLHVVPEPNQNAVYAGLIYSRGLNNWGVQLQRAGELDLAAPYFIAAQDLNPDNVAAGMNLEFNRKLRAGTVPTIDLARISTDRFGKARNWQELIAADGPIDEISYLLENGLILAAQNKFFRQATAPFTRVRQLAPDNLEARVQLAQIYIFNHLSDRALEALHDPLTDPARFSLTTSNSASLNILASAAYFQKGDNARASELLETELQRHPDDETLVNAGVQAYLLHGLYTNALRIVERKLAQTPDSPKWLFGQGYVELQAGHYDLAITSLTRVLELQTNNPTARFNRALAYLDAKNLDAARADYLQLQTTYTNSFQIAYGLGEIAWQKHDTNEAIRNYQLYLANARTNTAEATNVITRLRELQK